MGYALAFGWKQTGSAYDEAQYSNDTNRTEYAVTQAVIWAVSYTHLDVYKRQGPLSVVLFKNEGNRFGI